MDETSKTKKIWTSLEQSILSGDGIDVGCGPDPVNSNARKFDVEDGDANNILQFVDGKFDFVYSSHCLEHMFDPRKALLDWWQLVKPGGHLFIIVPDEDLYEQGVFPSRFNPDHKWTFTISKAESWSPVSINVLELISSLPDSRLVSIALQDQAYDRQLLYCGNTRPSRLTRFMIKAYLFCKKNCSVRLQALDSLANCYTPADQTLLPDVLAQIQFIVKKVA
jgi:SAM-dependent methyltransferase